MPDNGKTSTFLISAYVLIMSSLLANPGTLEFLLQDIMPFDLAIMISAILVAFYDYYYPRNDGENCILAEKEFESGRISTFLIVSFTIILGVFVARPDFLETLLGTQLYGSIGVLVTGIILVLYNYLSPRIVVDCLDEPQEA